jgi:hypothetical protein
LGDFIALPFQSIVGWNKRQPAVARVVSLFQEIL